MIELEKTYLAKSLPEDIKDAPMKDLLDIYLPQHSHHPTLRIRKRGDKYEITKKAPVKEGDASIQHEYTTPLTEEEFNELERNIKGKRIHKHRYLYPYQGKTLEIDVFQDDLAGLAVVDMEFENEADKDAFVMPDFCLADVTQEDFIAGGMLAGKKYEDIEKNLHTFEYQKINIRV